VTVLLLAALVTTPVDYGDLACERAGYMFFHRHLNSAWLDTAYNLLATAHRAGPADEYCLYLWSRIHIQKGEDACTKAEKLRHFGRAKAIAETLIGLNKGNAEGHCWQQPLRATRPTPSSTTSPRPANCSNR